MCFIVVDLIENHQPSVAESVLVLWGAINEVVGGCSANSTKLPPKCAVRKMRHRDFKATATVQIASSPHRGGPRQQAEDKALFCFARTQQVCFFCPLYTTKQGKAPLSHFRIAFVLAIQKNIPGFGSIRGTCSIRERDLLSGKGQQELCNSHPDRIRCSHAP